MDTTNIAELEAYLLGKKSASDLEFGNDAQAGSQQETAKREEPSQSNKAINSEREYKELTDMISLLAEKLKQQEGIQQGIEEKLEKFDGALRSLRNAVNELSEKVPTLGGEIKIEELSELLNHKIELLENKINSMANNSYRDTEEESDKKIEPAYEKTDEYKEETEEYYKEEEREEEREEEKEEELSGDLPKKKKPSILKKIIAFIVLIIAIGAGIVVYAKFVVGKNNTVQNNDLPLAAKIDTVKPNKQPAVTRKVVQKAASPSPKRVKEKHSMIDPAAIEKAKRGMTTAQQQQAVTTVKTKPVAKVSHKKTMMAEERDPLDIMDDTTKERSPIEDELLQNHTKAKDIAFSCRLKAKYPAGEYIYYIKEDGEYKPNPNEDAIMIEERSVVYNYSPDNIFVKVGAGKYLKAKLFANCSVIVPTR